METNLEQYKIDVTFLQSMKDALPEEDFVNLLLDPVELRKFCSVVRGS